MKEPEQLKNLPVLLSGMQQPDLVQLLKDKLLN